jgi:hypothetical protein
MTQEIYVFGSTVRGEIFSDSDIDVLVVPTEQFTSNDFPPDWSVYSRETLADYYAKGRLFAWHLHLEAQVIYSPLEKPWLKSIGAPAPYKTAASDIAQLGTLLCQSLSEIRAGTPSLVYEMGLIYTALRDIAMSASWTLVGMPCFSRRAPYLLPRPVPMPEALYQTAMAARHSSTRGAFIPEGIEVDAAQLVACRLEAWVDNIYKML